MTATNWLLAIDPGESSGWATYSATGEFQDAGICRSREGVYDLLKEVGPVAKVVIEDYRLFSHKAVQQSGSRLETVRVIGAIESWAAINDSEVILQPASIKSIAQKWSGIVPKGSHKNTHHIDAMLHGHYYLQRTEVIKPVRRLV